MSLYICGKLVCRPAAADAVKAAVSALATSSRIPVKWNDLEADDGEQLELSPTLRGNGLLFTVVSDEKASSGTELWNEAYSFAFGAAHRHMDEQTILTSPRRTRLGAFCEGLLSIAELAIGGIALVEGGIEETYEGDPESCLVELLRTLRAPWDVAGTRLYIWRKPPGR
jgi:hypothetical protein